MTFFQRGVSRLSLSRFDLIVLAIILVLAGVIGMTVVLGISEQPLRVAYLKIGETTGFYDIWVADPNRPERAEQMTFSPNGVVDFDVSGDGRYIVYSERDFETGIADIKLLDLRSRSTHLLTNCIMQDSDCMAPTFRPDGRMIAYERMEFNTGLGTGIGSSRIWLIDLSGDPPTTFPLFNESQILGYGARWSADGSTIAFYDSVNAGILVYDFTVSETSGEPPLKFVPSGSGIVGTLSPDGEQMIFAELLFDGTGTRSYLQIANLETGLFEVLTDPAEGVDDQFTAWDPQGRYIAISRLYRDERYTPGAQIYLVNLADMAINPLVYDPAYANGFFEWDPEGTRLAIQRFRRLDESGGIYSGGKTEVWTYDMDTRRLTMIDEDARNPLWVP